MISISGGAWRGRNLKVPRSDKVRPSSSMVRSALFNIVESRLLKAGVDLESRPFRCLDLFAGSGALGLEALSRGYASLVAVEKERSHAKIILENIRILGCEDRVELAAGVPVEKWLERGGSEGFDLIFADPPYAYSDWQALLEALKQRYLVPGGLLVCEHDPKIAMPLTEGLELLSTRTLGPAGISIFTR